MKSVFLVRYPEKPTEVPSKGELLIGRAEQNDVVLTERRVSRWHSKIEWLKEAKGYVVSDLGSSNGTYLNNKKISSHPQALTDRDKIRIASAVFTVRIVKNAKEIEEEFLELRERVQCQVTEVINIAEVKAMQQSLGLAGDLSNLCPVELFQMLESGNKTGDLMIKVDDIRGNFIIKEGQIIRGEFADKSAHEAVYAILQYNHGMFAFKPRIVNDAPQIDTTTTNLLMEGCRILDEQSIGS